MESKESTGSERGAESEKHHAKEVVRAAHAELRELMDRRRQIMIRIGNVKRTIMGLASVFGDGMQEGDWLELKARKRGNDQPGLTRTCRMVLMETNEPLTSREVCERVKRKIEDIEDRHKDPLASVTTVLNRLAEYGEARIILSEDGRRSWRWVSDSDGALQNKEAEKDLTSDTSPPSPE